MSPMENDLALGAGPDPGGKLSVVLSRAKLIPTFMSRLTSKLALTWAATWKDGPTVRMPGMSRPGRGVRRKIQRVEEERCTWDPEVD